MSRSKWSVERRHADLAIRVAARVNEEKSTPHNSSESENMHSRRVDGIATSNSQPAGSEVVLDTVDVGNHVKDNGNEMLHNAGNPAAVCRSTV